ncbi:hypothetical protein F5X98DRAFT_391817 [Xylaria grammica]|nr:hypothetical protein F5X98DRAFT_391817 [Xylaria grammica]
MSPLRTSAILCLLSYALPISAGPGAQVYACVSLRTPETHNFTVTFNPINGANKCMNAVGQPTTIDVYQIGVSCGEIGYVEGKASSSGGDLCATDESDWNLDYHTTGADSEKTGSIRAAWRKEWGANTNAINFRSWTPGAVACSSEALCTATDFYWSTGTSGPVYFMFQPQNQDTKLSDGAPLCVARTEL